MKRVEPVMLRDRARLALLTGDARTGERLYESLLTQARSGESADDRARLLQEASECLRAGGRLRESERLLREAMRIATPEDREGAARRLEAVAARALHLRDADALAAAGHMALACRSGTASRTEAAYFESVSGIVRLGRREYAGALPRFREAFRLSRGRPPRERLAFLQWTLLASMNAQRNDRAARLVRVCRAAAARLDPVPEGVLAGLSYLGAGLAGRQGDIPGCLESLGEAVAAAGRLGQRRLLAESLDRLAVFCSAMGWVSHALRAAERLREAVGDLERFGETVPGWERALLLVQLQLGRLRQAGELAAGLRAVVKREEAGPNLQMAFEDLQALARSSGDLDEARRLSQLAMERFRRLRGDPDPGSWLHRILVQHRLRLAAIELDVGNRDAAARILRSIAPTDLPRVHPLPRAESHRLRGKLAMEEGDASRAVGHLRRAWILANRNISDVLYALEIGAALAAALAAAGRRAAAADRLGGAVAWILDRIDAGLEPSHRAGFRETPHRKRICEDLDRAGSPRPVAPGAAIPWVPLWESSFDRLDVASRAAAAVSAAAMDEEFARVREGLERNGWNAGRAARALGLAPAAVARHEAEALRRVMIEHTGNQSAAARAMGIPRQTLVNKLKRYRL